jgi:hypothetical protein
MVLLTACGTKKDLVRTGAFYDIAPRFVRTAGNLDYFVAYGKGANEAECRGNAGTDLLKMLIYQGTRDGANINPVLNTPASIAAFKSQEQTALSSLMARTGLMDYIGKPTNRIRQSEQKDALYSMGFEIGINRNLLTKEIAAFK